MKTKENKINKHEINNQPKPVFLWIFDSKGLVYQKHNESRYLNFIYKNYKSVSNIGI